MLHNILKINLTGGIVSPGMLKDIVLVAQQAGIKELSFGNRQQLILFTKESNNADKMLLVKSKLDKLGIVFDQDTDFAPNIISSYCAEEVFPTGAWLSEGIYKDIFDLFDYRPKLKVNISDSNQSFTPFFTGNINFIASNTPNYWYLYVRPKQSNEILKCNLLIYSLEIPKITASLEQILIGKSSLSVDFFTNFLAQNKFITLASKEELNLPKFSLPYYEGFNRYGNKTWLGIYRRNESFSTDFLLELCNLCLETKVGQLCTTPWKSLIIKGIENFNRSQWDLLLAKYGINVRHAANELNWYIEDYSHDGLSLKKTIIREFDEYDVRSFGLCFAIQTHAKSEVFGSIIIKKRNIISSLLPVYDVYHTANYNPNSREYILFERGVNKSHVAEILQRLCKKYYASISKGFEITETTLTEETTEINTIVVHQCKHCSNIYDPQYGDFLANVPAETLFEDLPQSYECGRCGALKNDFESILIPKLEY